MVKGSWSGRERRRAITVLAFLVLAVGTAAVALATQPAQLPTGAQGVIECPTAGTTILAAPTPGSSGTTASRHSYAVATTSGSGQVYIYQGAVGANPGVPIGGGGSMSDNGGNGAIYSGKVTCKGKSGTVSVFYVWN